MPSNPFQFLNFVRGVRRENIEDARYKEQKELEESKYVFSMLADQYYKTSSPAARDHIKESMRTLQATMPPTVKAAMSSFIKNSPLDPQAEAMDRWMKMNKDSAPRVTTTPDEDPSLYAQQLFEVKQFTNRGRTFAGYPTEPEDTFVFTNSKGTNYLGIPNPQTGQVRAFAFEDAELAKMAETYNTTPAALKAQGGWVVEGRQFHQHEDGGYLYTFWHNPIYGGYRMDREKTDNWTGASAANEGTKFARPLPDEVSKALIAVEAGKTKGNVFAQAIEKKMEDVQKYTEDMSEKETIAFTNEQVQNYLSDKAPGWNFQVIGPESSTWDLLGFSPYYFKGSNYGIVAAPGRLEEFPLDAGRTAMVYHDFYDKRDLYYSYPDMIYLGTEEDARARLLRASQGQAQAGEPEGKPKLKTKIPKMPKEIPEVQRALEFGD